MKKTIFVAMALACAYATSFAQSKTPTVVTTAFNQKFPNAAKVKWDKENAHEYEASFEWKAEKLSANYSDTGEWLETESPIAFNLLPEKVQSAFNSAHKEATVKALAKIETSKGITKFEVEFKQGVKTIELFYTTDGTEIKE
ncbi:MAG: PepSY-like domain-containing protein [Bacteroidota bacterium]